ncbi:hypothetical protein [Campylobacter helveticus]|uniref:hypothetical protein n=1 Tax=Campylobacter helveticus TaxID=28898 RepID=UPI0022EACDC6|nr:hypothetical protein [Campylobacter helveticus]
MTKEEWDELQYRAKKVKNLPEFKSDIEKITGRAKTMKGNLHFGTRASYSKRNLAKGIKARIEHNERKNIKELDYLLPEQEREPNEYTELNEKQKEFLKNQGLEPNMEQLLKGFENEARADYEKHQKRKMPKNSQILQEAILNLESHHTEKDIKTALKNSKFPLKVAHIAIHRDEGHKNELTGETIKNYHAHIIFKNYDFTTHRTILRGLSKKEFRECQERLIKALGMQINQDKKERRHLSRYQLQYRKEKQAKELLNKLREYEKKQERTPQEAMRQEVKNASNFNKNTQDNTKPLKNDFER